MPVPSIHTITPSSKWPFANFKVNCGESQKKVRQLQMTYSEPMAPPDPTTDLHWSGYRGAIHEIFARNARAFPDRVCVIETPDQNGQQERVFTYQHIHEASNALAHHLVDSGLQHGEVVMIYAFRGVDLVVAVMGVLKAGATFSVIDPAYPPARQKIYLSVARPRALVILEKAGAIAPSVKEYFREELNLRTLVPGLRIGERGVLYGGQNNGVDILERWWTDHRTADTGVVVGPDSVPTLSFTSGSEGVPKGVRGRHFSLTYYFPWMAETFGLSQTDRFTMLSGIAHDPIQRDIFTPLFLGAQLRVPSADDIGTPGQLAEWMDENKATVTHLTPAMGQLLSTEAVRLIPSLRNAFFVGDVLTKRDCLRLQRLAQNVRIINMYGTTETQRAVSYFAIPPAAQEPGYLEAQKDVIPAGKGMLDVQLLVVNRQDRTKLCGVGEQGELYVRAAGLAEGYLQLPDLTAQKFVSNWFTRNEDWRVLEAEFVAKQPWKEVYYGARDRLYRTGDLGRYLSNGNVEIAGRADDQVKIRGFRIELGEIDTYLSQHPLVRENVTLVRRDKDEEPTLVSYFVPQLSDDGDDLLSGSGEDGDQMVRGLRRHRRLIQNIRDHLKSKLPAYSVPTVFVPLTRMPLNPNGKVDKPALPFPDTAQLAQASARRNQANGVQQYTPTQAAVRDIWLAIIPHATASIGLQDNFFDVGGHSILATRMILEIRKKLAVNVSLGLVFKAPTIEGLSFEIDNLKLYGINYTDKKEPKEANFDYYRDAQSLVSDLAPAYPTFKTLEKQTKYCIFITGVTGFLGAFILKDLFDRADQRIEVIVHVRATSASHGINRVRTACEAYGVWDESWAKHLTVVVGDLEKDHLGLNSNDMAKIVNDADYVIHNGAMVKLVN